MQDVPKIVLKRMARQAPARTQWHPDADLLTAFSENSLTDRERSEVMEHLAYCGDCREVMAIALPVSEAATMPNAITSGRGGWLSWPALRWGVVAAGLALVTSVGVLQYRQRHESSKLAAKLVLQDETLAAQRSTSSPQPVPPLPPHGADSAQPAIALKAQLKMKVPPNAAAPLVADQTPAANALFVRRALRGRPGGTAGGIIGGTAGAEPSQSSRAAGGEANRGGVFTPVPNNSTGEMVKQTAAQAPERRLDSASSSEVVEVQAQAAPIAGEQSQAQDNLVESRITQSAHARALTNFDVVGKAKDPVAAQAGSGSASVPGFAPPAMPLQTSPALMLHASPRWSISPAGILQRSLDAGKTWEDVDVDASAKAGRARGQSVSGNTAATSDIAAASYSKKSQKENMLPSSGVVFRAVAAIGTEVWAGGSASALYHSVDSGANWTRVIPSAAGSVLTGDITQIEFSEPQHGTVTTSTSELWITADGGQTWFGKQ